MYGKLIALLLIVLLVGYVFTKFYDSASYCLSGHGGILCKIAGWFA